MVRPLVCRQGSQSHLLHYGNDFDNNLTRECTKIASHEDDFIIFGHARFHCVLANHIRSNPKLR